MILSFKKKQKTKTAGDIRYKFHILEEGEDTVGKEQLNY